MSFFVKKKLTQGFSVVTLSGSHQKERSLGVFIMASHEIQGSLIRSMEKTQESERERQQHKQKGAHG